MTGIFSNIKDKLFPKPELDFEDDHLSDDSEIIDDVEIDTEDPNAVADAKKKNIIIVIVAFVLSIVVYFAIFSEEEAQKELIKPIKFNEGVTSSDVSPFQIDVKENRPDEDLTVLDKPSVPELPKMPEIKEDDVKKDLFDEDIFESDLPEEKTDKEIKNAPKANDSENKDRGEFKEKEKSFSTDSPEPKIADKRFKDARYAPIIVLKGDAGAGFNGAGQEDNLKILNGDEISKLEGSAIDVSSTFVKNRENVVGQGKIITGVLETAIDTEVAGSVRAIVSRDVYGEVGDRILISKGSRLYGAYSTDTQRGRSRININWTRLLRPDGVSVAINSIASDQFGRAGIKGTVDNKFGATVTNTVLSSILAIAGVAATDALTNTDNATTTTDASTGTTTITQGAINQAVSDIAQNITGTARNAVAGYFDTTPRITVPQGTRITILVNADIKIPTFKAN